MFNYFDKTKNFVIVKVSGFSIERFLNIAINKNIQISDITNFESGITLKVDIKSYYELRECAKKTKCSLKIIKKNGIAFLLNKYRKRKVLGFGFIFFIVTLYIMSSFIWSVNIEGNERISTDEITEKLKELNIYAGSPKFKINIKDVNHSLINSISEIAFISAEIKGTNLNVKIVETLEKTNMLNLNDYQHIVSKKDGIITNISIITGSPNVKIGDTIKNGQVLVRGEIDITNEEGFVTVKNTKADAIVFARCFYEIEETIDLNYEEVIYTDIKKTDMSITIFDKTFNFFKPNLSDGLYSESVVFDENLSIGQYILPISFCKKNYQNYDVYNKKYTQNEAKEILIEKIQKNMLTNVEKNDKIEDEDILFISNDNVLIAKATFTTIERVDLPLPFKEFL